MQTHEVEVWLNYTVKQIYTVFASSLEEAEVIALDSAAITTMSQVVNKYEPLTPDAIQVVEK